MDNEQLEQINELALALTQQQLDEMEIKLTVDFLTPEHALMIEETRGKVLDWAGWFKRDHNELANKFTLSVSSKGRPPMTIGAAVFSYDMSNHHVSIHMVEHFKRVAYEDPLIKRMGFLALNVAYIFALTVQATHIRVINPLKDAVPYYKYLNFKTVEADRLEASMDSIREKLEHLRGRGGQHDYEWVEV
ncbi:hypothetical protein [Enterobacter roggenkampii]|uniref:hypothetical protein n=1 Tax=Enterobacter roggenkampii TaxID=1812935 RepID=UPI001FF2104A|nr:hypothetical protein [Enterobacter roggenkampii]UOZ12404.1 hypothetical protein LCD41_13285 [Enterobacter roggenkampii]